MSNLYVYDFGVAQYIVDDSGERWRPVEFLTDVKTVICESCFEEATKAIVNEHGYISCWDCLDVQHIALTGQTGLFLDRGMGQYEHYVSVNVVERHDDEVVIDFSGVKIRCREIMLGGLLYGYAYVGDIDDPDDEIEVYKTPKEPAVTLR